MAATANRKSLVAVATCEIMFVVQKWKLQMYSHEDEMRLCRSDDQKPIQNIQGSVPSSASISQDKTEQRHTAELSAGSTLNSSITFLRFDLLHSSLIKPQKMFSLTKSSCGLRGTFGSASSKKLARPESVTRT